MDDKNLRNANEVLANQLTDPEFRDEWERLAPARAVANHLIGYRIRHELSQTALARQLGMTQSRVARLEAADHLPTLDTLMRLSRALDIEVLVDIRPRRKHRSWVAAQADEAGVVEQTSLGDDANLLVAVG